VSLHIAEVISGLPEEIDWIITVNDCSIDNTGSILFEISKENNKVLVLNHEVNMGVGGAMITGYKKSIELNSDITIKIDGDGQMDPIYLSSLLKPIKLGTADFTKGNRFKDLKALKKMPLSRRLGNLGLSFLIKVASGYWNIFDPTNGYTAIRNEILLNIDFNKISKRYFFESSLLIELYYTGAVVKDIPMKAKYGNESSGLSLPKTLIEFPPKLLYATIKRIVLKYFLFDFNIASVYILFGVPLLLWGLIYGIINFYYYSQSFTPAPTGTILIPTLSIILGFQLLLSAISFDINNYPKKEN
jgi:glycosyltransferase involved in cell wall biosynthesis